MTEKTLLKLSLAAKTWLAETIVSIGQEDAFTNAADADTIVQDPKGFNYALKRVREEIEKK